MNNILVSIIVPVFNVDNFLKTCVESLLRQTYENIEIILVDDGSTDGSGKICDDFHNSDDRIQVIHKKNGGSSSAREIGVLSSNGDYLMFVDGDDWLDIHTISICVDELIKQNTLGCILFSYTKEKINSSIPMKILDKTIVLNGKEAENRIYRRLFGLLNTELKHPERMENIVSCCMKLYRRDYALQGRYFDTKLVGSCEDGLFNMYALYGCEHMLYLDMPLYHYRKGHSSLTSTFKPNLIKQWDCLFDIMLSIIKEKELDGSYIESLNNRIGLSITAIGLNELHNPSHGLINHVNVIRQYISQRRYQNAVRKMTLSYLPVPWRILIICCKRQLPWIIYCFLKIIQIVR